MVCIYCDTHKVHSFFSAKYCSKFCFEQHALELQKHAEELIEEEEGARLFALVVGEDPKETEIRLQELRKIHSGPFRAPWLKPQNSK